MLFRVTKLYLSRTSETTDSCLQMARGRSRSRTPIIAPFQITRQQSSINITLPTTRLLRSATTTASASVATGSRSTCSPRRTQSALSNLLRLCNDAPCLSASPMSPVTPVTPHCVIPDTLEPRQPRQPRHQSGVTPQSMRATSKRAAASRAVERFDPSPPSKRVNRAATLAAKGRPSLWVRPESPILVEGPQLASVAEASQSPVTQALCVMKEAAFDHHPIIRYPCMRCNQLEDHDRLAVCMVCDSRCHPSCQHPERVSKPLGLWACGPCHQTAITYKIPLASLRQVRVAFLCVACFNRPNNRSSFNKEHLVCAQCCFATHVDCLRRDGISEITRDKALWKCHMCVPSNATPAGASAASPVHVGALKRYTSMPGPSSCDGGRSRETFHEERVSRTVQTYLLDELQAVQTRSAIPDSQVSPARPFARKPRVDTSDQAVNASSLPLTFGNMESSDKNGDFIDGDDEIRDESWKRPWSVVLEDCDGGTCADKVDVKEAHFTDDGAAWRRLVECNSNVMDDNTTVSTIIAENIGESLGLQVSQSWNAETAVRGENTGIKQGHGLRNDSAILDPCGEAVAEKCSDSDSNNSENSSVEFVFETLNVPGMTQDRKLEDDLRCEGSDKKGETGGIGSIAMRVAELTEDLMNETGTRHVSLEKPVYERPKRGPWTDGANCSVENKRIARTLIEMVLEDVFCGSRRGLNTDNDEIIELEDISIGEVCEDGSAQRVAADAVNTRVMSNNCVDTDNLGDGADCGDGEMFTFHAVEMCDSLY